MSEIGDADELSQGWSALRRGEWEQARAAFAVRIARNPDDAEAFDGLGRALWWSGAQAEALARRREAYTLFRRRGERRAAANVAIYLADEHRVAGDADGADGWLERAVDLLEGTAVGAEHGWLEIELAKRAAADVREHARHGQAAASIARELRDPDLEASALAQLGLARVDAGEIELGMGALDEALAIAAGEASDPFAIGDTCTTTLIACERLADFARAADWCRVVVDFTGRRGYTRVHLWCRTVYAGVLTISGDWERAERELASAMRGYEALGGSGRAHAVGRLAELRIRQGRVGEARTLLRGFEDDPDTAAATTALALADGDGKRASELVGRRLDAAGHDRALLAGVLPAWVDVGLVAGALDAAAEAVAQMREIGEQLARPDLLAFAHYGNARIAAARDEQRDALAGFEFALASFARLKMPLAEARARLALARLESGELAALHARTALTIFERLGAQGDADAASTVLRHLGVSGRSTPRIEGELTTREREVLELVAEGLTNQAIADRLFISPRTAEHHVGRILGKLGLRRRAEAAAYAAREDR